MISGIDLFNRYKEEKALVIGSEEERTGLEDYPEYSEWKAQYVVEYNETHQVVDVKEADAIFDAMVDDAEAELEGVSFEETEVSVDDDKIKAIAKIVQKERRKVVKAVKVAPKKKSASKTTKAQKVFDKHFGKKTRKEIIALFVSEVNMTPAGASTYYQKFKSKVN